jgi:hypothetical protein
MHSIDPGESKAVVIVNSSVADGFAKQGHALSLSVYVVLQLLFM